MKILIFGSTGGTGRQLVTQSLSHGYEVTAFARSPEKIKHTHGKLKIIKGNVLDISAVEQAMKGQDAVLCSLGLPGIMDKSKLREHGTKNIVLAMEKKNIKRLVCQSAFGAGDSHTLFPFHYRYFIAPLFMRRLYEDHLAQETCIKNSQLDWVIVRPGVLTDGNLTGVYRHGFSDDNKKINAKISRADTADFMIKQLTDDALLHKTPYVSY